MKIDKVILSNFRNYKGIQNINVSKKITILYGENGNGKSSFFDALEWCLTGKIARFGNSSNLKNALANKEIDLGEQCFVEIHFSNLVLRRGFERTTDSFSRTEVSIFEKKLIEGGTKFLKITSGEENVDKVFRNDLLANGFNNNDKKHTVGELINKAYILSQDQVTNFVSREKPEERYQALASIMGFEQVLKMMWNIETSISILNNEIVALNKEKTEIEMKIEHAEKEKNYIDNSIIDKVKKIEGFPINSKQDLLKEINELNKQLFDLKNEINKLKEIGNIENEEKFSSPSIIKQKITVLNNELQELLTEDKEVKKKTGSFLKLSNNILLMNKVNGIKKEVLQNELNLNKLSLNKNILLEEDYLAQIANYQNEINKIEFAKDNIDMYKEGKSYLNNFNELKEKNLNKLREEEAQLLILIEKENSMKNDMLLSGEKSHLNILINSIEDVVKYLKIEDTQGTCPICLSEVGEQLSNTIEMNLSNLIKSTEEKKEFFRKKLDNIDEVKNSVIKQESLLKKIKNTVAKNDKEFEKMNSQIEYIVDSELFSLKLFLVNSKIELENVEKEITEKISNLDKGLTLVRNNKILSNELSKYRLEEIEESDLDSEKVFKEIDLLKLREKEIEKEIKKIKMQIEGENSKFFEFEKKLSEKVNYMSRYEKGTLQEVINEISKEISIKEYSIELYSRYLEQLGEIQENEKINSKQMKLRENLSKYNKKIMDIEIDLSELNKIYIKIDTSYGKEATDFLNDPSSPIKLYYGYLNPNPSEYNNLHFEIEDGNKLFIQIRQVKNSENENFVAEASNVLSSGQLNVLALAIFLATNEAQKFSYFDFIAIDDPIQNMDDINRFSISDILSNLERPLIFSTHDQDFLNLFLKKNEHLLSDISLYHLNNDQNIYKEISLT